MGQQLDLFTGQVSTAAPAPPPAPVEEPPPPPIPSVLPGQIGLFDYRAVALATARAAVAAGKLDEAVQALEEILPRSDGDEAVAAELAEVKALGVRLRRIEGPRTTHKAKAYLALATELDGAPEPRASLRRLVLRRAADELRARDGDAGEMQGRFVGELLLEAGDAEAARASLAAAAEKGSARAFLRLGDALALGGDPGAARRPYRQALLVDPWDKALATVRDEEVRGLPDAVRDELDSDDAPDAWCAPVGMMLGVLPRLGPGEALPPAAAGLSPKRAEQLARARAFAEALGAASAARGDEAVAVRKRLKQASEALFKVYMERVVRGRAG